MLNSHPTPLVFCDVETTGGRSDQHRITEIACLRYDGGKLVDELVTLINPRQPIPYFIQTMTGITNQMVATAPEFRDVAPDVAAIFENATLVAHHARFDYGFIRAEMARTGYPFAPPRICTVKVSRALYPHERSHGLSALIDRHGLTCDARHRARGDAAVLVQFAAVLEREHETEKIAAAIAGGRGSYAPPPQLPPESITALPQSPGVYTMYDQDERALYVGKSMNVRRRVMGHFSHLRTDRAQELFETVAAITHTPTVTDLGAQLLEMHRIRDLRPAYNRRLRQRTELWGLVHTNPDTDAHTTYHTHNLQRLTDAHLEHPEHIWATATTRAQLKKLVTTLAREHRLCPRLLGIETGRGTCFAQQLGACRGPCADAVSPLAYNFALAEAFRGRQLRAWPFHEPQVIEHTTSTPAGSVRERFVVDHWRLVEATITTPVETHHLETLTDAPTPFDPDVARLFYQELAT